MPRVFISYSHDSRDHINRMLDLSKQLRAGGVDCQIDQYQESPPEGWPNWCQRQATESEFVLVVCTEIYLRRFNGEETPGVGLGVTWEGHIITQELYNAQGKNKKFIPITFAATDKGNVPLALQGATVYNLPDADEALYRRLTHQPLITIPPLGELKPMLPLQSLPALPELPRKQDFGLPTELTVNFIFVAGRRDELGALRADCDGYGDKGWYWRPYHPKTQDSVGRMAQEISHKLRLRYCELSFNQELIDRMRELDRANEIVVLVADAWSIRLKQYADLMRDYDEKNFLNCAVLVPLNDSDSPDILKLALQNALPKKFEQCPKAHYWNTLNTAQKLKGSLRKALSEIGMAIIERANRGRKAESKELTEAAKQQGITIDSKPGLNCPVGAS